MNILSIILQSAAEPTSGGGSGTTLLLLLIIGICIYLFVRARNKKKKHTETRKEILNNCPSCGNSIEQDAQFCENCGKKLN
jgi:hypothetical protein